MLTDTRYWLGVVSGVIIIYAWHWWMARKTQS